MPTLTPPPPPAIDNDHAADLEAALIEEARRRARRRRRRYGVAALALALAVGIAVAVHGSGGAGPAHQPPPAAPQPAAAASTTAPSAPRHNGPLAVIRQSNGVGGVHLVNGTRALGALVVGCSHKRTGCLELESMAFSPDGRRIAIGTGSYALSSPYDGLHVIDLATGADRQLTGLKGQPLVYIATPAWSPDGQWLALGGVAAISLMRADGSQTIELPTGLSTGAWWPTWSPDGTRLAFSSGGSVATRSGSVYSIGRDGSGRRLLAAHGTAPAWSPLGTTIAYRVHCGVRLVTPAGTDVTPARGGRCRHIGFSAAPVWSPDGRRLAIAGDAYRPGPKGLYVMHADGSGLRRISIAAGISAIGTPRPAWLPATG